MFVPLKALSTKQNRGFRTYRTCNTYPCIRSLFGLRKGIFLFELALMPVPELLLPSALPGEGVPPRFCQLGRCLRCTETAPVGFLPSRTWLSEGHLCQLCCGLDRLGAILRLTNRESLVFRHALQHVLLVTSQAELALSRSPDSARESFDVVPEGGHPEDSGDPPAFRGPPAGSEP